MNNYCPIPGASQPKEPVRLIDIKEILQYDGAHFTWSGGRNCLTEQKAAYARGYDAGMKFIVDEAKKAPTIDPESLRPTAHWEPCDLIKVEHGECTRYKDAGINCSKCKHVYDKFALWDRTFCPGCGSRMIDCKDGERR